MQTQKMCIHLQFYNSQKITGILKLNFAFGTNFKMKLLNCHIMNFIEKKNKVKFIQSNDLYSSNLGKSFMISLHCLLIGCKFTSPLLQNFFCHLF